MTKRQVERYYGNTSASRWACEQYCVEVEEVHGRKFVVALKEKIIDRPDKDFWDPTVIR